MAFLQFSSTIIGALLLVSIITFQLTGESRENKTKKRVFLLEIGHFLEIAKYYCRINIFVIFF